MDLTAYHTEAAGAIQVSRVQASSFAKSVAGDFNPIHNPDARRFCVPGDLLFSLLLKRIGLYRKITVDFASMVDENTSLILRHDDAKSALISGDKAFLTASHRGPLGGDVAAIDALIQAYVSYSGQTFPHILVPLWREHGVMVNPARPMVMYRSMHLQLERVDVDAIKLIARNANMQVDGKKSDVTLPFDITDGSGAVIGGGAKHMLLSGLRAWEDRAVEDIIKAYDDAKGAWQAQQR